MGNNITEKAISQLKAGLVLAYPTESIYGLGCDPLNKIAVNKILQLKKRSIDKGLILIAASFSQLEPYINSKKLTDDNIQKILATWPGPVTWVMPASDKTPKWIRGHFDTVAVRVIDHPMAKEICEKFQGPIVSTSANVEGQKPARNVTELKTIFADAIDVIIEGELGGRDKPSEIRDALTGKILRKG